MKLLKWITGIYPAAAAAEVLDYYTMTHCRWVQVILYHPASIVSGGYNEYDSNSVLSSVSSSSAERHWMVSPPLARKTNLFATRRCASL